MKAAFNPRSRFFSCLIGASLAAVFSSALATHAAAADQSVSVLESGTYGADTEALTRSVKFGDLNLETEDGAKVLYDRIRGAAKHVCVPFAGYPNKPTVWKQCFDHAVAQVVSRLNVERVTALHKTATRIPPAG